MIKECNFRNHGIYGLKSIDDEVIKLYCSMKTHDTLLSKDGETVSGSTKVNSLCDGEDNCILYEIYYKLHFMEVDEDRPAFIKECITCGGDGPFDYAEGSCNKCYKERM